MRGNLLTTTPSEESLKIAEEVLSIIQKNAPLSATNLLRQCARIAELLDSDDILWINNELKGYLDDDVPSYRLIDVVCHYSWIMQLPPEICRIRKIRNSFYETWREKIVIRASSILLESWAEKGHLIELRRSEKNNFEVKEIATITSDQVWEILHRIIDKIREFVSKISIEMKFKGGNFVPSLEETVASGLEKLGYEFVESMTVTPSGSSIDFVVQREGQLIGIEVKNRRIRLNDLRVILNAKLQFGFNNVMIVSNPPFSDDVYKFAKSNDIILETVDNILKKIVGKKISTDKFERNISNLIHFVNKQPAIEKDFLKEFGITLKKSLEAKTNDEKKVSLEVLGKILVKMIEGLDVIGSDVNTNTEEIDIIVKNESKEPFWQRLSNPFLIECKNWSKPVTASEIRNFDGKMHIITFRIMITINGITGEDDRRDAKGVIRDARIIGRHIIVLDKNDLIDIAEGVHPAERINAKFYDLYKL